MTLKVVVRLRTGDFKHYWFPTYPQGFENAVGLTFADDRTFQDWADDKYPGWKQHVVLQGVVPSGTESPLN